MLRILILLSLLTLLAGCAPPEPLFVEYREHALAHADMPEVEMTVYERKRDVERDYEVLETVVVRDHTLTQEPEALLGTLAEQAVLLGGDAMILRTDFRTVGVAYQAMGELVHDAEVVEVPTVAADVIVYVD